MPVSLHVELRKATDPQFLICGSHIYRRRANGAPCVQGFMRLAAPFGPPRNTGGLAFCREYDACSCCEHSHSGLIYNSLKAVLLDAGFSAQCKSYLSRLSCRCVHQNLRPSVRPTRQHFRLQMKMHMHLRVRDLSASAVLVIIIIIA